MTDPHPPDHQAGLRDTHRPSRALPMTRSCQEPPVRRTLVLLAAVALTVASCTAAGHRVVVRPPPAQPVTTGTSAPIPVPDPSQPPVPAPTGTTVPPPSPPAAPATYTVRAGDTITSIAAAHGLDPAGLCAANHLANCNLIMPGQTLTCRGFAPSNEGTKSMFPQVRGPRAPASGNPGHKTTGNVTLPGPCAQALATVTAHGLYLPAGWRLICPGRALAGTQVAGKGYLTATCPCRSYAAVTVLGSSGPEGPGPYVSVAQVNAYTVAYELCNVALGVSAGNSHDRESGGTLNPSTAQCVTSHGL